MIDVLRIAHLRIAPQEGNLEVGNCEGNQLIVPSSNARKGLIGCSVQAKDKKQTVIRKIIQMY